MRKAALFALLFGFLLAPELDGYTYRPNSCWICRRYMDPTYAQYDGLPYGYIDNINYPNNYDLPINRCFVPAYSCCHRRANVFYLQNCIRYTNWQRSRGCS